MTGQARLLVVDDEPSIVRAVAANLKPGAVVYVSEIGRMDVAGAYMIDRTFRASPAGANTRIAIRGEHVNAMRLLAAARSDQVHLLLSRACGAAPSQREPRDP